jgi:hypothetical protein
MEKIPPGMIFLFIGGMIMGYRRVEYLLHQKNSYTGGMNNTKQ